MRSDAPLTVMWASICAGVQYMEANGGRVYAETKIAAEEFLLEQKTAVTAPLLFRFATL